MLMIFFQNEFLHPITRCNQIRSVTFGSQFFPFKTNLISVLTRI